MRLEQYMINESISMPSWMKGLLLKIKDEMSRMTFSSLEKKCKESYDIISKEIESNNMKKIENLSNKSFTFTTESTVNEDLRHWWDLVKTEAFPTLAFYPALQVWIELDKYLKGTPYSGKVIGFYAALWVVLMTGKHISGWMKWRKENPEQYQAERESGGGRLF